MTLAEIPEMSKVRRDFTDEDVERELLSQGGDRRKRMMDEISMRSGYDSQMQDQSETYTLPIRR
jgi:hypothetical protein